MMNLIGEIAQYAIETDQVIRELAKQRDDLKRVADAQQDEITSLRRRIEDGMKENARIIQRNQELIVELRSVRNPDNGKAPGVVLEAN